MLAMANHSTPWTRADGRESAVKVVGLREGDKVWVDFDLGQEGTAVLQLVEGLNSLLDLTCPKIQKYRVVKEAGATPSVTSVEVFLA